MLVTCLLALALSAEPLDTNKAAAIEYEQAKGQAEVDKKFGNRTPDQMSNQERKEYIKAVADSDQAALDKGGVSAKEFANFTQTQGREEQAQRKQAVKDLANKDAAEAAKANEKAPQEVVVQRGISDGAPVTLEEKPGAAPAVEHGLPPEEAAPP